MLPPRPSFLPARPEGALDPAQPPPSLIPLHDPTQPGPSTCAICSEPPKYTCPGCSTRTCSAVCSKAHKVQMDCNGKRDPTKFVTLNTFSQGDWGGDYAYLENGRRKIADWGKDLPPSSIPPQQAGRGGHQSRGGGHGAGRKRVSPKVEGLRRELEKLGVDVEFMPEGMGRRKLNQSGWNPKTQSLHLTIQFSIPPSLLDPTPSASSSEPPSTDPKVVTHTRVLITTSGPQTQSLPTLSSLLPPPLDSADVVLVLPFHPSLENPTPIDILLRKPRPRLFFPPLNGLGEIKEVFRGMSFVEFPVIQVWRKEDWEMAVQEGSVAVVPPASTEARGEKRTSSATEDPTRESVKDEQPPTDTVPVTYNQERALAPQVIREEIKKPKLASTSNGLMALGDYESDSDDQIEDQVGGDETMDGGDVEVELTEEDIRLMRVLGAAAAADME